jgi:hypothetical protein
MATIIKLKRGTTTPTTGDLANGEVGIDTSAKKFYINDSGTIKEIGGSIGDATSPLAGDVRGYTGDGSTTAYTVSSGADVENVLVFVNGVYQRPTTDYTVSGTTLTFGTAPASADAITIKELVEGANIINDTGLVRSYTGDGSTTAYNVTTGKAAEEFLVFLNGVYQRPTNEYTVSSGTLTFVTAPVNADVITIKELAEGTGSEILTIVDDSSTSSSLNAGDTLTLTGGTGITTTVSGSTATFDIDNTVTTNSGTQTLTNKTINSASNTITITESDISDLGSYITASSTDTLTNKTIDGSNNTISNIGNSSLTNSSITINGSSVALGGSTTISTASTLTLADDTSTTAEIDLNSETLTVAGGTGITTAVSGNTLTITGSATQNTFSTINLNDSTNIAADSTSDTLNLDSSGLISITGDASTDTVTVSTVTSATIPFTKADGSSSDIDLQTQGSLSDVITNLYIPFINASGSSVTTLVVGSS